MYPPWTRCDIRECDNKEFRVYLHELMDCCCETPQSRDDLLTFTWCAHKCWGQTEGRHRFIDQWVAESMSIKNGYTGGGDSLNIIKVWHITRSTPWTLIPPLLKTLSVQESPPSGQQFVQDTLNSLISLPCGTDVLLSHALVQSHVSTLVW